MKKTIRLTENKLKNMIVKSVNNALNEMGTPKQNAFLRKLMGNRYKSEYDDLPVSKSSEMIDTELQRQKNERNSDKASPKQIDFIENNKYYSIPSIRTIADRLTKQDANALVSALNPYTNGMYTYYGHARQRKKEWLPQMKNIVVPILEKYGLSREAQDVISYVDKFIETFNAKNERKAAKEKENRFNQTLNGENTLFFISTKDEENMSQHQTERLSTEIYMDGILEQKMGWDIAELATDMTKYSIDKIKEYVINWGRISFPTIVLGYNNTCYTYLWVGYDFSGKRTICGVIVDEDDRHKANDFAKENFGKQANGGRLQENKLRKLIKKSVKKALCETSYDFVRKAHKAACDKGKFDQAERLHKHLVNKSSERFDPNMPVIIVGGDLQGTYTAQEIVDNFDINGYVKPSPNPIYTDSQLIGYPKIKGYLGPMWDGEKIRYESQDAYDFFSM